MADSVPHSSELAVKALEMRVAKLERLLAGLEKPVQDLLYWLQVELEWKRKAKFERDRRIHHDDAARQWWEHSHPQGDRMSNNLKQQGLAAHESGMSNNLKQQGLAAHESWMSNNLKQQALAAHESWMSNNLKQQALAAHESWMSNNLKQQALEKARESWHSWQNRISGLVPSNLIGERARHAALDARHSDRNDFSS
jgi:hypothetical protein